MTIPDYPPRFRLVRYRDDRPPILFTPKEWAAFTRGLALDIWVPMGGKHGGDEG